MSNIYIVVEGKTDETILKELFMYPQNITTKFFVAGGFSDTLSMAKTIYDLRPYEKIILIIDGDAIKGEHGFIFKTQLDSGLSTRINSKLFKVFTMDPNLEGALFPNIPKHQINMEYIKNNIDALRQNQTIKEIQTFIDSPSE